jgi:2-oxoglutarate dehydrogenase E1 component
MDKFSYLSNGDVTAIDELYKQYRQNPESVEFGWRKFFEGFEFQKQDYSAEPGVMPTEFKVINLIHGYRTRGHLFTRTNPVRQRRQYAPILAIENFGLSEGDLDTVFQAGETIGIGPASLRDIIAHLEETYCHSIGIEYMYIRDPERQQWIRDHIELKNRPTFNSEEKKHIFKKVSQATLFEQYIQKKFVGQKRFSVEGCEALIPAIDAIVEHGSKAGAKEFVVGMAHRGRLNVLTHIFGKPYREVFSEFEGKEYDDDGIFDGDVKYHLGYSTDVVADNGQEVHLTLCPNPSHLEAVNPVVEGLARAKIDHYLGDEKKMVPILVHGDAAVAGQGIVYEVIQMAGLDGYRTGGTIHIVVNNQVGFTTNYLDARTSTYCTDVAKTTLSPVFHVNADDVEAVVQVVRIALEYRQRWNKDVFIDLLGYRKYGHNEGDEPKFTQPGLYNIIAKHPTLRDIYMNRLISEGVIDKSAADQWKAELEAKLDAELEASKEMSKAYVKHFLEQTWKDYRSALPQDFDHSPETAYPLKRLKELGKILSTLPEGNKYFRKIEKLMEDRANMLKEDRLDWSMGELLAYATLLDEGHPVRISGQDVERGTFSHRHAVVTTEDTEQDVIQLNLIGPKQGKFTAYNSLLSEYGVLGFDYGYAFGTPHGLTIWEAQFGDFFNGAQIMIDQFISSAEDKWRTMNGLVMLLPHGYEGQGSEHSSGRPERFLQLCAENNMVICNVTTPGNYFHLLRRQVKWDFRKPLVVFTPKKLLRYPACVSSLKELSEGSFREVIDDTSVKAAEVDTVVFCTGKIYYEVMEEKAKREAGNNMAVVRIEQLYPMPERQILDIQKKYNKAKSFIWLQEEPENMGAWSFVLRKFPIKNLELISRRSSGSPAAGSPRIHEQRYNRVMNLLFDHAKPVAKTAKAR